MDGWLVGRLEVWKVGIGRLVDWWIGKPVNHKEK
jgi:hypothetical protein